MRKDHAKKKASGNEALRRSALLGIFTALAIFFLWNQWMKEAIESWNDTEPSLKDDQVSKLEKLGQIGDSFGSLNALLSGIAVVGVVFTIYRQHLDGKEAEERHEMQLGEQKRIARITVVEALVSNSNSVLLRMWTRREKILTLQALRLIALSKHEEEGGYFMSKALDCGVDGRNLVKLAVEFIPTLGEESLWKDVMKAIKELCDNELAVTDAHIENAEGMLKDCLPELAELLPA
jgi:hypothetical protein